MKIGANSFIWTSDFGLGHLPLLERVASAGLDGIEIAIVNPETFPAKEVRSALLEAGLSCTTCGVIPNQGSLASADPGVRRRGREHLIRCLEATAALEGEILCGPFFTPVGEFTGVRRTHEEWSRTVEEWQKLAPLAESFNLQIAIEPLNRFETYFLNTVEDGLKLCDEIRHPSVGLLFDTFHANIEEKGVRSALKNAARHLKHLHASENDRGIPGTGMVHWNDFFATVAEIGYNGWMVIESFGFSAGPMAAAASIWRDLADAPEQIAFQGAHFLRERLKQSSSGGSFD